MTRERRLTLLIGALVIAAGYYVWTRSGALFDAAGQGGPARSAGARSVVGADIVELDIQALEQRAGTYRPGRDPFRYARPVAEPPPAPRPVSRRPPTPRPEPQRTEEVQAGPRPPRIDFVYLGSFGRADQQIAVFADDESIYNTTVGDLVKDGFRLVAIGYESVDLELVDFPEEATRRLAVGGSRGELLR